MLGHSHKQHEAVPKPAQCHSRQILERVEGHGEHLIGRIDHNDSFREFAIVVLVRQESLDVLDKVAMGINDGEAVPSPDVLTNEKLQEFRLPRSGRPDHVHMGGPVFLVDLRRLEFVFPLGIPSPQVKGAGNVLVMNLRFGGFSLRGTACLPVSSFSDEEVEEPLYQAHVTPFRVRSSWIQDNDGASSGNPEAPFRLQSILEGS